MTIRERVLAHLEAAGDFGVTVQEFLRGWEAYPTRTELNPQSVYPVFTKLCQKGLIKDSRKRRRTVSVHRRCIVWWLSRYGGTIPVWGSGRPRYSYTSRAKRVLDFLVQHGPLTAPELTGYGASGHGRDKTGKLTSIGTSSLLSSLAAQGWVRKTRERRISPTSNRRCTVWDITSLGRSVREKRRSK